MASAACLSSAISHLGLSRSSAATRPTAVAPMSARMRGPQAAGIDCRKKVRRLVVSCSGNEAEAAEEDTAIEFMYDAYPTVMDINQIRDILQHRYPFLLVDKVIGHTPDVSIVGIKNVTITENFFPGHFPDSPIMPGVLILEAMAQVGGLLLLQSEPKGGGSDTNFFFAGMDKVRFKKPVTAGDTLVIRMTLTKFQKRFGIAKLDGKTYVGGELVCEGEFIVGKGLELPCNQFIRISKLFRGLMSL